MNELQQAELRALREEQRALRQKLGALDERLVLLERQASDELVESLPVMASRPPVVPPPALPTVEPPPLPSLVTPKFPEPAAPSLAEIEAASGKPQPRALKPPKPLEASALPPEMPPLPAEAATRPAQTAPTPVPTERESLEVRIGSTWLVRVGVVLALTGFAYFGAFLYQNVVPHLGPAAKVVLLYLGAGALTGAGAWLERSRQAQENLRLRNYAAVVFAGGLSAVYYVTYAAHYFERLRVVPNAIVAGAMLLAWTAFMVFLAHRRNSETLATIAILLAYYTSAINEGVAAFTLFSNLALTGGTVFLLRRHLWRVFPFASVLATFGSYGFWTYFHSLLGWRPWDGVPTHAAHGSGGFWIEAAFLATYWALFTWVVFTAKEEVLPTVRRAGFASLNNGAFFALTTWLVLGQGDGWFWKWALGFGAILLALSELCRRWKRPADGRTEDAYLLQGVLLVSTGFIAYFEGWQLSVVLAVQAVALLAAGWRRERALLVFCSMASALLAFWWSMLSFENPAASVGWITPLGVGALLVGAATLAQRIRGKLAATEGAIPTTFAKALDLTPPYYALLGSVVWWALIAERADSDNLRILLFAGAAVALTASVYVLRVRELPLYAQAFLAAGFLRWFTTAALRYSSEGGPSNWTALALFVAILAVGHWWQRLPGRTGWTRGNFSWFFNTINAALAVLVVWAWFSAKVWASCGHDSIRTAEAATLALALAVYGAVTRYRALVVASQWLLLVSAWYFVGLVSRSWFDEPAEAWLGAVPWLVVLAELAAVWKFVPLERSTTALRGWVVVYEVAATLMFLAWAGHFLHPDLLFPVYTLAGTVIYVLGAKWNVRRWATLSLVPTLAAVVVYLLPGKVVDHANPLALLGVALLAGQQQWARRCGRSHPGAFVPKQWQAVLMVAATLCGWVFVTSAVGGLHAGFGVTAGWSLFAAAVFTAGLLLRERVYRWAGLLVMGATLVRIVFNDIMGLDSLGKAISIFALAGVLLGVGFLYNKYQDRFRDLL